ncbi:pantothenate synthetase [Rhodoligotrophos appendicifer]
MMFADLAESSQKAELSAENQDISPEVREILHMLRALEQRNETGASTGQQTAPAKP